MSDEEFIGVTEDGIPIIDSGTQEVDDGEGCRLWLIWLVCFLLFSFASFVWKGCPQERDFDNPTEEEWEWYESQGGKR